MERVHLYVEPLEAVDRHPDILLNISHDKEVFPEGECIALELNLEWWAATLLDYAEKHEPKARLIYDAAPDIRVKRRDDGGHTMRWLALEWHADGTHTPYWYKVDLDFDDFMRQIRDALVMLDSDPARSALRGRTYERAIAALSALLGENDPPPGNA